MVKYLWGYVPVASAADVAPEGDERPAKKQKTTAKAAPALTNITMS
jgi:hypothetical protein